MRQRRMAVTGGVAAGLLTVVGLVAVTRDDDPGRIAITDSTGDTPTSVPTSTDGAPVPSTDPSATDVPEETTVAIDPPVDCPAVGLTYLGAGLSAALIQDPVIVDGFVTDDLGPIHAERSVTIDEDGTTISIGRFFTPPSPEFVGIVETDDGWVGREDKGRAWVAVSADDRDRVACILQTIVYDPELELLEAQSERMVTAIDGNGDAVVLSWNGVPTVLHDGTDPDDAPPEEGEVTSVDGVAVPFRATRPGSDLLRTGRRVVVADAGRHRGHVRRRCGGFRARARAQPR